MARKNPEFAHKIKKNYERWTNSWKANKDTFDEYMQFTMGNQWLDEEARVFETYKKIPLTFNKIAPIINHLLGEQRQNTPSLQCVPDESVKAQTAEVREALVKDISLSSDAKVVYQTAFQCALIGGYGAFYLDTEYENTESFNQVICIRPGYIPTMFFWDPSAKNPSKTDGLFAGYKVRMSRTKFRSLYGKRIEEGITPDNLDAGTFYNDDDSITVFHYYERKCKTVKIYLLSNGKTIEEAKFDKLERVDVDGDELLIMDGEIVTVDNDRLSPKYKVKHHVYAGEYELEVSDFPSEQLPVVFVDQNSFYDKHNSQVIRPFIKDTKDAQRYINFIGTQSAYLLKIGRYDQFLVSKENVRSNDTQQIWRDPLNIQGGLRFDESPSGFIPQQLRPPELSQSLVQQYERALQDIQTSTGVYNAQLGEQGNEISGAAIDARTRRGSYSTYVPFDSLNRAIACCGQVINEMIPTVYDTNRKLMIEMKDKGMTPVEINKPTDEFGGQIENDMTTGNYSIRLIPGPSWEGQKQEALDSIKDVLQANPQMFQLVADLYAENLPFPNNIELRNRLRTVVPPEIIQAGKTGEPIPPKPPEPNPQMMAAQAKMQEVQLKSKQLEIEMQKLQLQAQETQQDMALRAQELEDQRLGYAAELQEMELRYSAESQRSQSDIQIAHANNLVKLLTHTSQLAHTEKLHKSKGMTHDRSEERR